MRTHALPILLASACAVAASMALMPLAPGVALAGAWFLLAFAVLLRFDS
jgi:hypothetical protein